MAFTIDSLERDNRHQLTGLPVGGVHSISLVALVDLPSPVAGPVTLSELFTVANTTKVVLYKGGCFFMKKLED